MLPIVTVLLAASAAEPPANAAAFFDSHCVSCHAGDRAAGRLDLAALQYQPDDPHNFARWVRVHDRVRAGEMPPKKILDAAERDAFTAPLAEQLRRSEASRYATDGRSTRRRLNRVEYENAVRDLLHAPWLPLKDVLPEDAIAHGYTKSGDVLDVSHVQMARYLEAADRALRQVLAYQVAPPQPRTVRYYARDQESFTRRMFYSPFNTAPERATFPTLGFAGQPDVRAKTAPVTDSANKDLEGIGLVAGAYEPVEPKFDDFAAPVPGRYKLRFHVHTCWVGPNGTSNKLQKWFIPDLNAVSKGRRSEPITVYSERPPRQLRKLGWFDADVEPTVKELDVDLLQGETIRPDAARLFRSRPGDVRWQNPLAERDGQPGVVYRWLEVEGPIHESWPPPGHKLLFGDMPLSRTASGVEVVSTNPEADARRLLANFVQKAYRRPVGESEQSRFLPVISGRMKAGATFTEAMLAGYTAVLCSPEFLTLAESPGRLNDHALAARLAFFLWNSPPDAELRALADRGELGRPDVLRAQTDRLLADAKSRRFRDAFLDYWLELRKMTANSPDAALYGDYYLDDWLGESAEEETRHFFAELVRENLPVRNIIDSDFVMINERLATHYDLPPVGGTHIRKVKLPKDSIRGGLLTQASVLTVTANGTTTSPVLRGVWILERIIGKPTPPPPPVPAVEPDLRGTTTIREQLARHRDQASCAACHSKIDPPGFALESFDVMGGYREHYRALGETNRVPGLGKSGQPFAYCRGPAVDGTGEVAGVGTFQDVREFKQLLLRDEEQIARNVLHQLTVYATGAPVGFADRDDVDKMLAETRPSGYGVRSLIHGVVQSELFRHK